MLKKILHYNNIAIQCHNIPDADSLASGFALYKYLEKYDKSPLFFYAGPPITKPNLIEMVQKLNIPIQHQPERTSWNGLLITVDCQYGMGNVKKVEASHVAVIDHHMQESTLPELCDLRPWLGSCSTLVWDLFVKEKFPIDTTLSKALLYGLFMDTNGFSELTHPLDRDMWEALAPEVDKHAFKKLKLSNLTLDDLQQISMSLDKLQMLENNLSIAIIPSPPCDPNILGLISDLAIQVDSIDNVLAYSILPNNDIKFSVRTTARHVQAHDLASWLAHSIGSGGGHREKAGGYISHAKFQDKYKNISFDAYCKQCLYDYDAKHIVLDCLHAETYTKFFTSLIFKNYRKRILPQGYIKTADVFGSEVDLHIRTLEGDIKIKSGDDTFLMLGIQGEVYPIERPVFAKKYNSTQEMYRGKFQYEPSVLNINTGRRISLLEHAYTCYGKESNVIQGICLNDNQYVKIFTQWDQENYYSGSPGDWLVKQAEDDFYIVNKEIFAEIYLRDFTNDILAMHPSAIQVQHNNQDMAWAVKVEEDFTVHNSHKNTLLFGKAQDVLIQYAHNHYEIFSKNDFEANFITMDSHLQSK